MSSSLPAADTGDVDISAEFQDRGPVRKRGQAVLNAVPAILLIAGYLWMAIAVPVAVLEMQLPNLPVVGWVVLAILAVPGLWLTWKIVRQCVFAEQMVA